MINQSPEAIAIAEAMRAASDRRLARRADFIIPTPARRLPPRARSHSRRHRALR